MKTGNRRRRLLQRKQKARELRARCARYQKAVDQRLWEQGMMEKPYFLQSPIVGNTDHWWIEQYWADVETEFERENDRWFAEMLEFTPEPDDMEAVFRDHFPQWEDGLLGTPLPDNYDVISDTVNYGWNE